MRTMTLIVLLTLIGAACGWTADGMITVPSAHDVAQTASRLETALADKGMKVFIRIDHAQGAAAAGLSLRPTELIVFGNPKVGTPLMLCAQSVGIDLPQKILIWQDADGRVWLSYNDPAYLAGRHGLTGCDDILKKVAAALDSLARAATGP